MKKLVIYYKLEKSVIGGERTINNNQDIQTYIKELRRRYCLMMLIILGELIALKQDINIWIRLMIQLIIIAGIIMYSIKKIKRRRG